MDELLHLLDHLWHHKDVAPFDDLRPLRLLQARAVRCLSERREWLQNQCCCERGRVARADRVGDPRVRGARPSRDLAWRRRWPLRWVLRWRL